MTTVLGVSPCGRRGLFGRHGRTPSRWTDRPILRARAGPPRATRTLGTLCFPLRLRTDASSRSAGHVLRTLQPGSDYRSVLDSAHHGLQPFRPYLETEAREAPHVLIRRYRPLHVPFLLHESSRGIYSPPATRGRPLRKRAESSEAGLPLWISSVPPRRTVGRLRMDQSRPHLPSTQRIYRLFLLRRSRDLQSLLQSSGPH